MILLRLKEAAGVAALTHGEVWGAIDALAARYDMSVSALARLAGLDPTALNRSKRLSAETPPRPRWPSTESVAKLLDATGMSFGEFAALAGGRKAEARGVPLLGFAQAGADGFFDDAGFPVGQGWDEVDAPGLSADGAYALEIQGASMQPVYREGDRIIVSPTSQPRRGDRVVVKTVGGEVMAKEVARLTAKAVELRSLNPEHPGRTLPLTEVAWMARIVWASQ